MKCYAMITELSNRARYVKFGVSTDVAGRRAGVQGGCPLRIEFVLEMDCGNDYHARVVEAALHLEHTELHVTGEWFRFPEGTKAKAAAHEALRLMGERVFARAVVLEHGATAVSKPRMYRGKTTRTIRGYAPVVGDRDISAVTVVSRRKLLKRIA